MHLIELLEARIAPASVFVFTDVDGDLVKILSSRGDLNAPGVATLELVGGVGGNQLTLLNLSDISFQGATITTSVTKVAGGDGLVHLGRIDASNRDLTSVTIQGDLAVLDVGDGNTAAISPAIKLLSVRSMGTFGLSTQGGVGDLISDIQGLLGALKVTGDVNGVHLQVTGDTGGSDGKIGSITIGGSLIGGATDFGGVIQASGNIGAVKIGHDVSGGTGSSTGILQSDRGVIKSVTLGGSLLSGSNTSTGQIRAGSGLGPVMIAGNSSGLIASDTGLGIDNGDLLSITIGGSLIGGAGTESGRIRSSAGIGLLKVGHDVGNGAGMAIISAAGKIGSVSVHGSFGARLNAAEIGEVGIGGDLAGNILFFASGQIAAGKIARVTIGGSLLGGPGDSGAIIGGVLGTIKIGGDVVGGVGDRSGAIFGSSIGSVTIGHSLIGGAAGSVPMFGSGLIRTLGGDMGAIQIGGDLRGGLAPNSGRISSAGKVASLTIGGSILGTVADTALIAINGDCGPVEIGGDLHGGPGSDSGLIFVAGKIVHVTIGGSMIGGNNSRSGVIRAGGDVGPIGIGGDLLGGSISGTHGSISESGYLEAKRIASITIGGSIISGIDTSSSGTLARNASIRVTDDLGPIVVKGSVIGNFGDGSGSNLTQIVISARGQAVVLPGATSDIAIKSLTIGSNVALTKVLAGFNPDDPDTAGSNGNASIGAVKVGGNWFASSLSAGVQDTSGNGFADGNDDVINNPPGAATDNLIARIASIRIGGEVSGVPNPFFQCGFVAQQIGFFRAGLFTAPLTAATDPAIVLTPYSANVTIREI